MKPARRITIGSETHTIREWERIKGVRRKLFAVRISKGDDPVKAILTPVRGHGGVRGEEPAPTPPPTPDPVEEAIRALRRRVVRSA